jgi:iron only hydrogenase large subunit-like protein
MADGHDRVNGDASFLHSVRLDKSKCKGCTTCLRRCPTEAIRVYDGSAHIIAERCIDCGMCIRVCPYHAKVAVTDPLKAIEGYAYKIALPAPTLYGQFKGVESIDILLEGLLNLGFDDIFEVARGAEFVSPQIARRVTGRRVHNGMPLISSACPAIVRLIQVRFPELLGNVIDLVSPMDAAAIIARRRMVERMGCKPEEVGVFFITPCAAKMTAIRAPQGLPKSPVDGAISILDVYGRLGAAIRRVLDKKKLSEAGNMGVGWAQSGGEMRAVGVENALNVDGIENVIEALEAMENGKLSDLEFFEGLACTGGCLGGALTFENTYVAKNRLNKLIDALPRNVEISSVCPQFSEEDARIKRKLEPNTAFRLDEDMGQALEKMKRIEEIADALPGLDCGSCGSPSCRALAEDVVLGFAVEQDCIMKMKKEFRAMALHMLDIADKMRE